MASEDFYIVDGTLIKYKGYDERVVIPKGVKTIGRQAFSFRGTLTEVVLSEGVEVICDQAFESCTALKRVVLPDGISMIGKSAFSGCRSLDDVVIPEGVEFLSAKTFAGCASLSRISLPSTLYDIGEYAFHKCFSLEEMDIGDNVTEIGEDAFSYCRSLKRLSLGKGIVRIKWNSFAYCESLEKVAFSVDLREIVYSAFVSCPNLSDIYYSGDQEDWKLVSIAPTKNGALLKAKIHFNYDKPITNSGRALLASEKTKAPAAEQISFDIPAAVEKPSINTVLNESVARESIDTDSSPAPAAAPVPQRQTRATVKSSSSPAVSEEQRKGFYSDFISKLPSDVAEAQKARAADMSADKFEALSEALFLVPEKEAFEFGCMCLFMKKYNKAFRAFLSAAGKGNLPSQYYVGCCFLWGIDTTKKIVDASRWLKKCKDDVVYGKSARAALAQLDEEFEKPENAGLKIKRGNK